MIALPSPQGLARASAQRPWLVVGLWLVLLLAGGLLATRAGSVLTTDQDTTAGLEAERAEDLLEQRLTGPEVPREFVIVQSAEATVDQPGYKAFVGGLLAEIRGLDGVQEAVTYYDSGAEELVSPDRHNTLLAVTLAGDIEDAHDTVGPLIDVLEKANGRDGFEVITTGVGSLDRAFSETAERDLRTGELIGLPVALLVLLVVFGAAVAAGLPIVLAALAIVMAIGATTLIGQVLDISYFVTNFITMIGLAVGIDYSLFIVGRFREERRHGVAKIDAIATAGATAGRAVLFSGLTVIVALAGMMIVPDNLFRSMAAGAILAVVFAVLPAMTLLPAALSLLGDRVNALRLPLLNRKRPVEEDGRFWGKTAALVMRRPWLSVAASVALLATATIPYFSIELGFPGPTTLPRSLDAARAFDILDRDFSAGLIDPTKIVIDAPDVNAPGVRSGIERLRETLASDSSFAASTVETNQPGDLALVAVPINGDAQSNEALDAIGRLRDEYIPSAFAGVDAEVLVTGHTAFTADYTELLDRYTPFVFVFVLGLSFVLLLVVFRSIVVPLKAIVMNLLSVGAAYGVVVAVFQHGIGNELLGFQQVDRIASWIPIFLFAMLFGLSMDYHVFLLSRIR